MSEKFECNFLFLFWPLGHFYHPLPHILDTVYRTVDHMPEHQSTCNQNICKHPTGTDLLKQVIRVITVDHAGGAETDIRKVVTS